MSEPDAADRLVAEMLPASAGLQDPQVLRPKLVAVVRRLVAAVDHLGRLAADNADATAEARLIAASLGYRLAVQSEVLARRAERP